MYTINCGQLDTVNVKCYENIVIILQWGVMASEDPVFLWRTRAHRIIHQAMHPRLGEYVMGLISGQFWLLNGNKKPPHCAASLHLNSLLEKAVPSRPLSPWTVENLIDKHSKSVYLGIGNTPASFGEPWLILLMDGLFFFLLKWRRMWMSVSLAGYIQSSHPSLCLGARGSFSRTDGKVGVGAGFLALVYSLQLLCSLPSKEESSFPSWLRRGELPSCWSRNWVAWSRPRQSCSLILHQMGASLIGFSSLKAASLQKKLVSFIGK